MKKKIVVCDDETVILNVLELALKNDLGKFIQFQKAENLLHLSKKLSLTLYYWILKCHGCQVTISFVNSEVRKNIEIFQ